ncbi:RNA polymerase sigma factor (sigma-70 family) [Catalinimonas alkaloidigena]|uniref:RNA polymerase sigma factor n=1 Tax=Catalinimonas alkaloidigena TaxID=1075417 RepID=UPI002404C1D4|nr:sigma-70 family RNA polymerase sigma factor [Catalinimonas alkaloidigena]MDF9794903.1 RNA polymerase sigma factor (sigma-70 family) [Catalinimonas alkaloidigena]
MKEEFIAKTTTHEGIIHKVCKMYCHQHEDRQDLFQDIVLQLWKAFPKFRKEAKLSTWMYRIALNTAITRLRKETKKPLPQDIDQNVLQIPSPELSVEDEQFSSMIQAIDRLSDVEKAITLLYLEEQTYKEIAQVMGISESNVGYKINRIKHKLRSTIQKIHNGT